MTIERFDVSERMCDMTAAGAHVFISGQVPTTLDAAIELQTREVLDKLDAMLSKAGTSKANLMTVTVYLTDFRHYDGMNLAWDKWLDRAHPPARDCFKVEMANPGWKVEIVATAIRAQLAAAIN